MATLSGNDVYSLTLVGVVDGLPIAKQLTLLSISLLNTNLRFSEMPVFPRTCST